MYKSKVLIIFLFFTVIYEKATSQISGTGINFHPGSYKPGGQALDETIGGWSAGCIVVQKWTDYYQIWDTITNSGQTKLTLCII